MKNDYFFSVKYLAGKKFKNVKFINIINNLVINSLDFTVNDKTIYCEIKYVPRKSKTIRMKNKVHSYVDINIVFFLLNLENFNLTYASMQFNKQEKLIRFSLKLF